MDFSKESAMPGYTGYRPRFDKDHVEKDPHRVQNKYADTAHVDNATLGESSFNSAYRQQIANTKPGIYHPPAKSIRSKQAPYKPTPVAGWKSVSHSTFTHEKKTSKPEMKTEADFVGQSTKKILQPPGVSSTMASHYTNSRSLKPTTDHLAVGTAKGAEGRMPGYSGHVSQSELIKNKVSGETRNSLIERNLTLQAGGYKHNKMGYQGHVPTNFANDTRRPVPANAKDTMKPGLRTGIVVPSMNLT
mmetsp:Transcript_24994/g.34780  ORF Transcript_24994/g.34780 Transcript_24994/m.34780 type:complete len:246 (-) Transcript_24994:217-954(-)|eukprot:CAMPEP_0184493504 /NCGR_PEP_ID=MMETSP0113_2-20130426/26167_1 /TAXON_ID=91329 /ORGANISM="Norrisiella sphaerica, Strain BC52" /LENGTH=245 /DNA_ID=CAMNT_0026878781 /DNA_START=105 /DNA_END=842 /DNA_ORIENTATION=-